MINTIPVILLCLVCWIGRAAVPTLESFEPTQFDTNSLRVKYRSDWTNELGVLRPATLNSEVTVTNLNLYETLVLPAKVVLLTLGTNELNVATNSTWLLHSPTNDATQVILSLAAGKFQGQLLFLTSQNGDGAFTLPDDSEQYDVPGALVDLQGDWVGTTNRGVILQYTAPDWIEMARFNPSSPAPEGFTTGVGVTNISNVLSGNYTAGSNITLATNANGAVSITAAGGGATIWTNASGTIQPFSGQTTNRLSFTSGAPQNNTNVAFLVNTSNAWAIGNQPSLILARNMGTNKFRVLAGGEIIYGANTESVLGLTSGIALTGFHDTTLGDPNLAGISLGAGDPNGTKTAFDFFSTDTDIYLTFYVDGDIKTTLNPTMVSGSGDPAYLFDTSLVQTNGDSLFSVRNAGIDRFIIQHNGTLSIQNTTNRLGVVAGVLQLDGVNIGGSSSTIITTNHFEYNGNVTFKNAVYVTNTTIYINGVDVKTVSYGGACSDETTALTAGTAKLTFRMPHAMTVTAVRASLTTAQTSGGLVTVDINDSGTTILSTKITLDNGERTSTTAATPPVLSDTALADDAEITVDLDSLGDGTAKGLKIWITGLRLP